MHGGGVRSVLSQAAKGLESTADWVIDKSGILAVPEGLEVEEATTELVRDVKVSQMSLKAIRTEKQRLKRMLKKTKNEGEDDFLRGLIKQLEVQEDQMQKRVKKTRGSWDEYRRHVGRSVAELRVVKLAKSKAFQKSIHKQVKAFRNQLGGVIRNAWNKSKAFVRDNACSAVPVKVMGVAVCSNVPGCRVNGDAQCVSASHARQTGGRAAAKKRNRPKRRASMKT